MRTADAVEVKMEILSEPMVQFHHLVTAQHEARLARHQAPAVWDEVQATVDSNINGPHLEDLAREWTAFHAAPGTLGATARTVGAAAVACRQQRGHEIDVAATGGGDRVVAIGEAIWRAVTTADVERLRHIRDITPGAGGARLLLFSATRSPKLASAGDVEVVDLERLYTGS